MINILLYTETQKFRILRQKYLNLASYILQPIILKFSNIHFALVLAGNTSSFTKVSNTNSCHIKRNNDNNE